MTRCAVCVENNILPLGIEYLFLSNDKVMGSINPAFAQTFKTKSEAEKWIARWVVTGLCEIKIIDQSSLEKDIQRFDEWFKAGCVYRQRVTKDVKYNIPYDPATHTPTDVLEWHALHEGDAVDYDIHETWPELFMVFDNLNEVEKYYKTDTEDSDELNTSISMSVSPKSSFSKFKKEFNLALRYVTLTGDNCNKIISIMDDDLSFYGTRTVKCLQNGEFMLQDEHCKDLKTLFNRWKTKYPYTTN